MITIRPASERGPSKFDWLDSRHSFSFGGYHDPRHMGFRALRVINEDRVVPGAGFPTHGHRDMEIISYVLDGALKHQDNMGNGTLIKPGEVQVMSAGTGVLHSEYNPSPAEPVHFLQIWILPDKTGTKPGYQQKSFPDSEKQGRWRLVVSPDGADGSLTLHQDAKVYATLLNPGDVAPFELRPGRAAWLQVARGAIELGGKWLGEGDGAAITDESHISVAARDHAELILFDLA
ncbi:MAG: pirin family protein [Alphaproteobacteria bacterium]